MKLIEDIFSKVKKKKEKKISEITIIIDTREKQSLIAANLIKENRKVEFETLEIGDYLIGDTIIERKEFSDFVNSIINKRLFEQLTNLKKYKKHFLIIEGFEYNYKNQIIHENAIRGMLISIALDYQVPVIFTKDEEDTAKFLILTAKKYEKPKQVIGLRQSRTFKTDEEQKQFILEGFPGIGPTLAKNLLKEFKSLKEIFNADEEKLKEIPKFDENKRKKFKVLLD